MVAATKSPATHIELDSGRSNSYHDYNDPPPVYTFSGFIFVCSNGTVPDLNRGIFGLPDAERKSVCAIKKGMPLFLFNYSNRCLYGVFEAASDGGFNLDPYAWENVEVRRLGKPPVSKYPAQVRVQSKFQILSLHEETFRSILDYRNGHKFRLQLSACQVKQLLVLFSADVEFRGARSSTGFGTYVPDSPRSAFKSDSDCYSECSSKGTCLGDDEWAEDEKLGKETTQVYVAHGNSEPFVSDKLSHLSLSDGPSIHYKLIDESSRIMALQPGMPTLLHGINTAPHDFQQSAGKKNVVRTSSYFPGMETFESKDVDQVSSRFHEADPAVNSNTGCVDQPQSDDEEESVPYIPAHIPHFLGYENAFYIPVQALQPPTWSVPKKLAGNPPVLKAGLNQENPDQAVKACTQKLYCNQHPIYLQSTPYGQILLPLTAARPGSVYDSNQMTAMFPPVLLPPYSQGVSLGHLPVNAMDQIEEAQAAMNFPHLHSGGLKPFLHNGRSPVSLVPSFPWMPPIWQSISVGLIEALHFNILQFARLTRPSAESQLLVEAVIDSVRSCVRAVWSNADVEVFGSFSTGLCLQHSDVDLVVLNAPRRPSLVNMTTSQASSFLLRELGFALKASKCCDSYNIIANASVPVLKFFGRPIVKMSDASFLVPSVAIDLTIGGIENGSYQWRKVLNKSNTGKAGQQQHTGGAAREYVLGKIRELPALAPLVLLLKSFLQHRNLSNVYLGGLGSFSLTLLLVYYLERVPLSGDGFSESTPDDFSAPQKAALAASCLSDVWEEFEVSNLKNDGNYDNLPRYKSEGLYYTPGEYYVRKAANIIEKVLGLWDVGGVAYLGTLLLGFLQTFGFERDLAREKIVLKGINGTPGGIFKRDNKHIALWIDDPLRPGVNIAAGSFRMCQVQAAFREMRMALLLNGQPLAAPLHCDDEEDCQDLSAFRQLPQLNGLLIDANDHHDGLPAVEGKYQN